MFHRLKYNFLGLGLFGKTKKNWDLVYPFLLWTTTDLDFFGALKDTSNTNKTTIIRVSWVQPGDLRIYFFLEFIGTKWYLKYTTIINLIITGVLRLLRIKKLGVHQNLIYYIGRNLIMKVYEFYFGHPGFYRELLLVDIKVVSQQCKTIFCNMHIEYLFTHRNLSIETMN